MRSMALGGSRTGAGGDDGQILILVLGYVFVAVMLVIVAVDVTALYLARTQLRDAADATALDAADAADTGSVYAQGLRFEVPLTDETVRTAARSYLASYLPPSHIDTVRLGSATGSPDGRTAVVQLSARVRLPLLGPVVSAWTGGITVTAESRASADVDAP
jgi:Putative Flp pilus-assembly TadE/G-like